MKVTIILPAYNEEARISSCLDNLISYLPTLQYSYEIIISADGCTDETENIALKYASSDPKVFLLSFPERLGKGGGILYAANAASGDVLLVMDVDLATSLDQIPLILGRMKKENADIIYGSRNLSGSTILVKPPIYRKILGKGFNCLFRLFFGINLHDTQCGFKAIRRDVFSSLSRELNIEGFAFDIDLAVKAVRNGYKILEMPIVWSHREGSRVNVVNQIFEMGRDLLIVWLEGKKRDIEEQGDLKAFYNGVPGDVYEKASKSKFFPRKWWHNRKNEMILSRLPDAGSDVLDVGFGSGTLFDGLRERRKQVSGIDIGEGFIKFVRGKYGSFARIAQSDAQMLPFRDEIFDYIICSEVLEHVPDPKDALNEMYRVLKPGGEVLITTPNISLRWSLIEAVWTHLRKEIIETSHVAFTRRRLRFYLLSSGFTIKEDQIFMFGCLNFAYVKK